MKLNTIHQGNCIELMKQMPENSVDAIVTDPPYGLEFMGKEWDSFKEKGQGDGWQVAGKPSLNKFDGKNDWHSQPRPAFRGHTIEHWRNLQKFCQSWAKQALRVLKAGGFLLSFGGTRTYHRMACGIEDAGFEIRDCIQWLYSTGFPKSLNISKQLIKTFKYECGIIDVYEQNGNTKESEKVSKYYLRPMSETNISETINIKDKQWKVLQSELQEQSSQKAMLRKESEERTQRSKESCLERWSYIQATKRELQRCKICQMSEKVFIDGKERWLCNGTPFGYGTSNWKNSEEDRSCSSYRPQSSKQQKGEFNVISKQYCTQKIRSYEEIYKGQGTALKPANEPIVVARKPLSEKNVALNVLKYGTGGINIDGCRIECGTEHFRGNVGAKVYDSDWKHKSGFAKPFSATDSPLGRFPANIILDEFSAKILDNQSGKGSSKEQEVSNIGSIWGSGNDIKDIRGHNDSGGASRFFYVAKASREERNRGLDNFKPKRKAGAEFRPNHMEKALEGEDGNPYGRWGEIRNIHPTVKPVKLMQYLVRLVTPKGGVVLDPFIGSGTTAIACYKENFNFIGIEKEEEYVKIANARIEHYMAQTKLHKYINNKEPTR